MTRPVGAINNKYEPPREVRQLREGQPITRDELLAFGRQMTECPAALWMTVFFGGDHASPCPVCRVDGSSLGVAGNWPFVLFVLAESSGHAHEMPRQAPLSCCQPPPGVSAET